MLYIQILIRFYWHDPQTERAFVGPFSKKEAREWRRKYRPLRGELSFVDNPTNDLVYKPKVYKPNTTQVELHNFMWTTIHSICHG